MRKIIVTLLAVLMMLVSVPDVWLAEEFVSNEQEQIKFDYSDSVIAGTIRYISQVPTGEHFHAEYWPENSIGGRYSGAKSECKTSCISMALSYLGIDRTPADMLLANNGATKVDGWGATYRSVDVNSGMTDYLTGKGIFSPVLIHLKKYSDNGHYILLVGQLSKNVYQALDPWECAVTSVELNGKNATYTKSGKVISDTIVQSGQWYLDEMPVAEVLDSKEEVSVKESQVPQIVAPEEEDSFIVFTDPDDFSVVRETLEKENIAMADAEVTMIPQTYVELTDEQDLYNINKILSLLEEDDDVQEVYHNWDE